MTDFLLPAAIFAVILVMLPCLLGHPHREHKQDHHPH
jgi:hypothetical protein